MTKPNDIATTRKPGVGFGPTARFDRHRIESLDRDASMLLLRTAPVGRVGISVDALPVIFPVNFVVARPHDDAPEVVVLRVGPGTKFEAAMHHNIVAFEADGYDPMNHTGWSVLAQGRSQVLDERGALDWARTLPLQPWALSEALFFVTVALDLVSGRRFGVHPRPPTSTPG